jgi:hypothetical protein
MIKFYGHKCMCCYIEYKKWLVKQPLKLEQICANHCENLATMEKMKISIEY